MIARLIAALLLAGASPLAAETIAISGGAKNKFPGGFPASMKAPIVPAITSKNPRKYTARRIAT